MDKQENPNIPIQANERKIYPMTADLIDRAEANTAKNLEKYLDEERKKLAHPLTDEDIKNALDPKNLSPADQKLVEAWTADGLTPQRMAELLILEM